MVLNASVSGAAQTWSQSPFYSLGSVRAALPIRTDLDLKGREATVRQDPYLSL